MNINRGKIVLKNIFHISSASMANRLIYYIKRLPLVGGIVPDGIYSQIELKQGLAIIVALVYGLYRFFCKVAYVGLMVVLPVILMTKGDDRQLHSTLFLHIFFFLSCIAGAIQAPKALETKPNKFICIRLVGMDPQDYTVSMVLFYHFIEFIYFLPCILIGGMICDCNFIQLLLCALSFPAFRLMGEALQLWIYQHTQKVITTNYILITIILVVGCILAYLPYNLGLDFGIANWLYGSPLILLPVIGGIGALLYILHYPGYRQAAWELLIHSNVISDPKKKNAQNRFRDVKLRDSDFKQEELNNRKYKNKTGYAYLNALFFERHRRMITLPLYRRLVIIAALFVAGLFSLVFFPDIRPVFSQFLARLLPIFCFVMYFASIGERVCRAMFYNCDISLLRYSYYRQRRTILKNFQIRLFQVVKLNLILASAICLAVAGLVTISGVYWPVSDMIFFVLAILFLSLFFSVHHLFLYYVFQPYTTELNMKNPLFNIINGVVYLICYGCLQLDAVPSIFALIVLGATLTYIVTALILVYHFAPQNFRIK